LGCVLYELVELKRLFESTETLDLIEEQANIEKHIQHSDLEFREILKK
jgi:hypothetical protein